MSSDLRQGVSDAQHAVLDRHEVLALQFKTARPEYLLKDANRAAAASLRASPDVGTGRRRVDRAREAAALLLLALDRMDADGRPL